jgi:hypothetical protein
MGEVGDKWLSDYNKEQQAGAEERAAFKLILTVKNRTGVLNLKETLNAVRRTMARMTSGELRM